MSPRRTGLRDNARFRALAATLLLTALLVPITFSGDPWAGDPEPQTYRLNDEANFETTEPRPNVWNPSCAILDYDDGHKDAAIGIYAPGLMETEPDDPNWLVACPWPMKLRALGEFTAQWDICNKDGSCTNNRTGIPYVVEGGPGLDTPTASLTASATEAEAPARITFDLEGKPSPVTGKPIVRMEFDPLNTGDFQITEMNPTKVIFEYTEPGPYKAVLRVQDAGGVFGYARQTIQVSGPEVSLLVFSTPALRTGENELTVNIPQEVTFLVSTLLEGAPVAPSQVARLDFDAEGDGVVDQVHGGSDENPWAFKHTYDQAGAFTPTFHLFLEGTGGRRNLEGHGSMKVRARAPADHLSRGMYPGLMPVPDFEVVSVSPDFPKVVVFRNKSRATQAVDAEGNALAPLVEERWDFGDGHERVRTESQLAMEGDTVTHTYFESGVFPVTLAVMNRLEQKGGFKVCEMITKNVWIGQSDEQKIYLAQPSATRIRGNAVTLRAEGACDSTTDHRVTFQIKPHGATAYEDLGTDLEMPFLWKLDTTSYAPGDYDVRVVLYEDEAMTVSDPRTLRIVGPDEPADLVENRAGEEQTSTTATVDLHRTTVLTADEVQVAIPPFLHNVPVDAPRQDVWTLSTVDPDSLPDSVPPISTSWGIVEARSYFRTEPGNPAFQNGIPRVADVEVRFTRDEQGFVNGTRVLAETLRLFRWDGDSWEQVPGVLFIDLESGNVHADVAHFSLFGLGGLPVPETPPSSPAPTSTPAPSPSPSEPPIPSPSPSPAPTASATPTPGPPSTPAPPSTPEPPSTPAPPSTAGPTALPTLQPPNEPPVVVIHPTPPPPVQKPIPPLPPPAPPVPPAEPPAPAPAPSEPPFKMVMRDPAPAPLGDVPSRMILKGEPVPVPAPAPQYEWRGLTQPPDIPEQVGLAAEETCREPKFVGTFSPYSALNAWPPDWWNAFKLKTGEREVKAPGPDHHLPLFAWLFPEPGYKFGTFSPYSANTTGVFDVWNIFKVEVRPTPCED